MDFTPHTPADVAVMLEAVGLSDIDGLFSHIPESVRLTKPLDLPGPMSEAEVMSMVDGYGAMNRTGLVCFAGGGIYDHTLSPAVRAMTLRPEFVTSYTPYQSEVAQGVLQVLYEYQSMVATITGLPAANASLYDGATALVEAASLAAAATGRTAIWVSRAVHPHGRQLLHTFMEARGLSVVEHPVVAGRTAWAADDGDPPAAVVFGQPNYLGVIEDYDEAVEFAHGLGALAVASVDPMTLGMLRRPGDAGVDIVVAEGQPLGNPMSYGGPVVGLFATTMEHVRRLPGRLVGKTKDAGGRDAYVLTLRTREQDIRRERASSNICTNQTLNAIGAAAHLAWLGPNGLRAVGTQSAQRAHYLAKRLVQLPGVHRASDAPFVREFAMLLPMDPAAVVTAMADRGFLAGIPLSTDYPELPGGLLIAVTERRTKAELDAYVAALEEVIADA